MSRICVNLLYHLIETMRWCDGELTAKEKELREDFKTELGRERERFVYVCV